MSKTRKLAQWLLRKPDPDYLQALADTPIHPIVQHLLALRKVGKDIKAESFLNPRLSSLNDPYSLFGMDAAVVRILTAIENEERITLYGDYDVDGITSVTLLTLILRAYGNYPACFLPSRMGEGYGLSIKGLTQCFENNGKPNLLIALDCGTCSVTEVQWLRQQNIDCVIVDHHEPGPTLPDCQALVNPKVQGHEDYYCTVALVFKLAHALMKRQRIPDFDLKDLLDLVALGTVADLVPLLHDNRILVHSGLKRLTQTSRVGITALKTISGIDGPVQTQHISFRLGPRLNAVGRLNTAHRALDLLLTENEQAAGQAAQFLDASNKERQEIEGQAQSEAEKMIHDDPSLLEGPCLIVGSRNWHQGVVGIVASRLMRTYHRPTIVISIDKDGLAKGSGRSVPGISLVDALNETRHLIESGGGHAMAAGVSLLEKNLPAFRKGMNAAIQSQITGDELLPKVHIDVEVKLKDLTPEFFADYARLEPYGMGNPEPNFLVRGVFPQLPGQILKAKHWKMHLQQKECSRTAIWFNADLEERPQAPWDVIFKLQRQSWRGVENWQIMITDVRCSDDVQWHDRT